MRTQGSRERRARSDKRRAPRSREVGRQRSFLAVSHYHGDFIRNRLSLRRPAFANMDKEGDLAHRRRALEQATIYLSLPNLKSFQWVARSVERGELQSHGA